MTQADPPGSPDRQRSRQEAAQATLLEFVATCGFAFAQPLLDVFGRAPDVFLLNGVGSPGIVAYALAVTLVPPLVLWVVDRHL